MMKTNKINSFLKNCGVIYISFIWGEFSPKQIDSIFRSTARINIWDGAVRSGKTVASLVAFMNYARKAPEGPLLICGKTLQTLKRNILDLLIEMAGEGNFSYKIGKNEAELFGRKIYLTGANDSRAESKIRGITLAGAYGDEITLWPKEFFAMLLSRLSIAHSKFYGTTNPDSKFHWLMTDYFLKKDLFLKRWQFTLDDNFNLDESFIKEIKKEYSGLFYKRFIEGEWCCADGIIYDMFDPDIHIKDKKVLFERKIIAIDYGIQNPCVFGLIGITSKGEYHLIKEYYYCGKQSKQKTDNDYLEDLKDFIGTEKISYITVDPSASSLITLIKNNGFKVIPAKNNVIEGIRMISGMLCSKKLSISKKCIETAKEFEAYAWDRQSVDNGYDKPLKTNDHCMDMLRYAVFTDKTVNNSFKKSFYSGKGAKYI